MRISFCRKTLHSLRFFSKMRIPFVYGDSVGVSGSSGVGVSGCAGAGGLAVCWAGLLPQNAPPCDLGPRSGPGRRLPGFGRLLKANSWSERRMDAAARRSTRWPSAFAPLAASSSRAESTSASCLRTRASLCAVKSSGIASGLAVGGWMVAEISGRDQRARLPRLDISRALSRVNSGMG